MNKRRFVTGHCLYSHVNPRRGVSTPSILQSSSLFIHALQPHVVACTAIIEYFKVGVKIYSPSSLLSHFHHHLNSVEIAIKHPITLKPCLTHGAPSARFGPISSTRLAGRARVKVVMKMILQQWQIKPRSCRPPPRHRLGIAGRSSSPPKDY